MWLTLSELPTKQTRSDKFLLGNRRTLAMESHHWAGVSKGMQAVLLPYYLFSNQNISRMNLTWCVVNSCIIGCLGEANKHSSMKNGKIQGQYNLWVHHDRLSTQCFHNSLVGNTGFVSRVSKEMSSKERSLSKFFQSVFHHFPMLLLLHIHSGDTYSYQE